MRLKKVTQNDPIERLAVSIKRSTAELLEGYRGYYRKCWGDEIEKSQLVEQILREFIMADREYIRSLEAARAVAAKPATRGATEAQAPEAG